MLGFLSDSRIELNVDRLQVNVNMEITVDSAMPAAVNEAGQEDLPPPVVASEFQQPAAEIEPKTDEGTGESDITREAVNKELLF